MKTGVVLVLVCILVAGTAWAVYGAVDFLRRLRR